MKFGIFYEHQLPRPWHEGAEHRLLQEALEQVELADQIGIDYAWEVEHHFLEEYSHSSAPEIFLAACSQRTKNIRLGHGICLMPPKYNHPARVAERIATLDLVSSGRVEFGTGESASLMELGGFNVGLDAAAAMTADIKGRFPIDLKRMYTAGMSGGARVAIMVAQNSSAIAGVLASSAGYSSAFHKSERFPFFGSAGTEDFNYREMQVVDRMMTSPHRVEVFEGGHSWLPVEMATSGVEWMEIQAMKNGLRPRDETLVAELFSKRMARATALPDNLSRMRELKQIAADFETLRDVAKVIESAAVLERALDVPGALSAEQADDARELRVKSEVDRLVRQLGWAESADAALVSLKSFVASLLDVARQPEDSSERRIARRVLAGLRASRSGVPNHEFQEWIVDVPLPAPPQPH